MVMDIMICIDFQGGAHGNFLEFACNVAAGVKVAGDPFNIHGASHDKKYQSSQVFVANHYSFLNIPLESSRVIAVKISVDDLLLLTQVSLLRAGDYGYDNNQLEINTYNKLNNLHYRWVLDNILNSFFTNQVKDSYNAVKDSTWPDVITYQDFQNLPEHIRNECLNIHHLELFELTAENPDCPRHILREFFQLGFEDPLNQGFITQQHLMVYNNDVEVYDFPFSAFYTNEFLNQLEKIAHWANLKYTKQNQVVELHKEFLKRQPYQKSKIKCDQIVQQLISDKISPPRVTLIEEAYINAMLKKSGYECRY